MTRTLTLSLLAAVLMALPLVAIAGPAHAAEADHAPGLLTLVRLVDVVPSADQLRAAAPQTEGALYAIAADADLDLYPRRRAASLLSAFPNREGAARLKMLVDDPAPRLRWIATYTYVRAFGPHAAMEVLPFAAARLQHSDALQREAVVRGLAYVPGPAAEDLVRRHDAIEKDPTVRAAIRRFRRVRSR